jgi:hypothetical protein
MPDVNDILDRLSEAKIFTTLDLKAGFHNIPLPEEASDLTTFIT